MLYVFQVDTGMMMTFEMRLVMEPVCNLKKAIAIKTDIPENKQVLLISGGECLDNSQRHVGSYSSAGTDTSPIFLFAKINIESNQPPMPNVDYGDDTDMTEMIESCMSMQPSLDTLVARTELAADLNDQAIKQKEICERLVHDQHLQQQGWAAVTANLEDLTRAFKNSSDALMQIFGEFIASKPNYEELLTRFKEDIKHLDDIPILPALIVENNKIIKTSQQQASSTSSTGSNQQTTSQSPSNVSEESVISLRQWIEYLDNNNLEKIIEICRQALDRFTEANAEQIRHEVQELLKEANNKNMKEIKGLEERLFGLEKLMVDAKKVVDEQSQLASSFQNNRERFSKIKDSTLLPDLSASHKQQLQMMLTNHKKMSDYRNRCIKAKHELSINLHARLKWIMFIEQQIGELNGKIRIYGMNISKVNRQFETVKKVNQSPDLYLVAVVEAMRRRRFTKRYKHWANSIAKISQELYENEMNLRKEFDKSMDTHFLSNLFPGMVKSYPPPFATIKPDPFDTKLPRIIEADIQYLKANLSDELAEKLCIPKDVAMPHIISVPINDDSPLEDADDDDRHSLNPTPPSSPTRQ